MLAFMSRSLSPQSPTHIFDWALDNISQLGSENVARKSIQVSFLGGDPYVVKSKVSSRLSLGLSFQFL